jgi:hypothetical protein
MTKYRRAYGLANALDDAALKKLWTLYFLKQINMTEQQLLPNFKKAHLTQNELGKITTLATGIFDVATMTKLLTKLGASLEYYEPDAMVKSYLYQHAQSLGWDRDELNVQNPKERDSNQRGNPRSSKRKSPTSKRDGRDPKVKRLRPTPQSVASHDQCKRKACREKGTHINHTHKDCRFKSSDRTNAPSSDLKRQGSTRHPNLGQAPLKKTRNPKAVEAKKSSAPRPKRAHATFATNLAILHLTVLIRQLTSKRPKANCSKTRISWCYGKSLGTTKPNRPAPLASLKHGVMTTYALCVIRTSPSTIDVNPKTSVSTSTSIQSSPLLKLIREAHEGTDEESSSTDNLLPFSMNHSYFVGEDEGQQDDNLEYNQDHSDDKEGYIHSQSDSPSDAESTHESRDYVGSDNDSDASSHHSDSSAPY